LSRSDENLKSLIENTYPNKNAGPAEKSDLEFMPVIQQDTFQSPSSVLGQKFTTPKGTGVSSVTPSRNEKKMISIFMRNNLLCSESVNTTSNNKNHINHFLKNHKKSLVERNIS
jgi:hypothetical protein